MNDPFRLLMICAMYENGGNVTHRLLDGHPELFVYPFESQLGTKLVQDSLTSLFPVKYRWPVFDLSATPERDYRDIIDEECKVRARTPHVSKFRHMPFEFSDEERLQIYQRWIAGKGRSRANNVEAFFRSTFEAWKDHKGTGREQMYVGYSPILVVDAEKILADLPQAHVLHVVRNPWSAYADTKKRPVPLSLPQYMLCWTINQMYALRIQSQFPARMHVLRTEDILAEPHAALGALCKKLELEPAESLKYPSWNSVRLDEVYPWGTIRKATPEANLQTAKELTPAEVDEIRSWTSLYLDRFDYTHFVSA